MEQETLRHQYLEAIGVSSWLPCAVLPGAATSADWINDFRYPAPNIPFESDRAISARAALGQPNALSTSAPTSNKASAESAQQGMSQARAALGLSVEPVTQSISTSPEKENGPSNKGEGASLAADVEQVVTPSSIAPVDKADDEPPNFKLAFQRLGDFLIVDSLPPQGGVFSDNYQILAQAIVNAVGDAVVGEKGHVFMLPWPMFASKTLDQGHQQASIAVQHKLEKELQASSFKAVLLFGEAAAQMVLARKESLDELKGISFEIRSGIKAIASHSLTEAMQLPGIKKQIWTDLQPLVVCLSPS